MRKCYSIRNRINILGNKKVNYLYCIKSLDGENNSQYVFIPDYEKAKICYMEETIEYGINKVIFRKIGRLHFRKKVSERLDENITELGIQYKE